jgi:hypothetical protein
MVDIHNSGGGIDIQDDALHGADQVVAHTEIRSESDNGVGQRNSPFQKLRAINGNARGAFYSFRKLSEGNSRVKAPCPSGYDVRETQTPNIRQKVCFVPETADTLTAPHPNDILNGEGNGFCFS